MRVIPVIDLYRNQAVHALMGEREKYQPVKSVLCNTADPMALARAFRDRLGLREIYIADLDSIQGSRQTGHRDLIAALARAEALDVILDAGISEVEQAREWLGLGVRKAVVGAETLRRFADLREIPSRIERDRIVFSLDTRNGKILSQCPELAAASTIGALEYLHSAGWPEVILLDLKRVGSGRGVDSSILAEAKARFPGLSLLAGGGIAGPEQLFELKSLGLAGVLVGTALHRGIIAKRHVSALLE